MSELNNRQWSLYNLLKDYNGKPVHQETICSNLYDTYPEYGFYADENFHDSKARHVLSKDIQVINNSDVIQKVIISSSIGIFLASKENYKQNIEGEYFSILRKLKRCWKKIRKFERDNQCRITFGSEREYIEAFVNAEEKEKPEPKS